MPRAEIVTGFSVKRGKPRSRKDKHSVVEDDASDRTASPDNILKDFLDSQAEEGVWTNAGESSTSNFPDSDPDQVPEFARGSEQINEI